MKQMTDKHQVPALRTSGIFISMPHYTVQAQSLGTYTAPLSPQNWSALF